MIDLVAMDEHAIDRSIGHANKKSFVDVVVADEHAACIVWPRKLLFPGQLGSSMF
jgi:hypothetical protein